MSRHSGDVTEVTPVRIAAWSGSMSATAIAPVHEVNEQCIELLVKTPRRDMPVDSLGRLAAVIEMLHGLRPDARRRAAQRPFLLLDFNFSDAQWWQLVRENPAQSFRQRLPRAFSKRAAVRLARATLMLAWHMTRSPARAACLALGMTAGAADVIGALTLEEIERVAEHQHAKIRPRWEDQPLLWRTLLAAARADDAAALRDFDVHAIQLIGSEMIPHCP